MVTVTILFLLVISTNGAPIDAKKQIENQFGSIQGCVGSEEEMKLLIQGSPEVLKSSTVLLKTGNYIIQAAHFENDRIIGSIEFKSPSGVMEMSVEMNPEPRSSSGWTMSIKTIEDKKSRVPRFADDDCEWWGCIDG
uniref:DsbC domain-containing protein n=1 Tax=Caenorhabditis tropicalis TaxID=1561998 RepID=A0A1I7UFF3_9PELO